LTTVIYNREVLVKEGWEIVFEKPDVLVRLYDSTDCPYYDLILETALTHPPGMTNVELRVIEEGCPG
jgi:hypothetical protein